MLVIGLLTIHATRFARRHRRAAVAATSLLLAFGMNITVDPPPPPRIETVQHKEEAEDDEPK